MAPADRGDKAGASADESASGAREINKGDNRPPKRRGRGALFPRKVADTALEDGMPVPGTLVSGRFRIEKLIAKGGMGTVWRGIDIELDRPVAVKFMDPSFAEQTELRSRFTREAKAAAKLRTKHVVEIHEFGVDGTTPFIVMELLEGEDLHTHLKRNKRVNLETAASIVVQCCRALKMAGDAHIVHRDLKPGNVYLSRDLDEIVVKILDFGVAKIMDAETEVTRAGTMLGSPQYMSPEQAVGDPVDHRSDLWSLAGIIFRMLTGHIAFSGKTAGDIIIKLCTAPIPVPSEIRRELPKSIDKFFERAFARQPDERFQSASELSAAFVAAVAGASAATDPKAFASLATYADMPSGPGLVPSDAEGTPISYSGTPVSGVLSASRDPITGASPRPLSASEVLDRPIASENAGGPESGPGTGVTRAADLQRAEAASQRDEASRETATADAATKTEPKPPPELIDYASVAEDVVVHQRGLPPVVWVLFVAAMAAGAFIAFFVQSKPETGSLLEDLDLKPPVDVVNPPTSASAATVIDPVEITPDVAPVPSAPPSAEPSASVSAALSAEVAPPVVPFPAPRWPQEKFPQPKKPLERDLYE